MPLPARGVKVKAKGESKAEHKMPTRVGVPRTPETEQKRDRERGGERGLSVSRILIYLLALCTFN